MTLPASFPLSMSQISSELGLSVVFDWPLSIDNPLILALAGKTSLPVSFSDLLGQSGHVISNGTVQQRGTFDYYVNLPSSSVFFSRSGGYISTLEETTSDQNLLLTMTDPHPSFTGNIKVTNATLNRSLILSYIGNGQWGGPSGGGVGGIGIFGHAGSTYTFTIYPAN